MLKVVIMAGGRGSRLGFIEKPLLKICNKPMIQRVIEAIEKLNYSFYVAASPLCMEVIKWCIINNINYIVTKGIDYVHDLDYILQMLGSPLLVLPSDMPFLTSRILKEFLDRALSMNADVITLSVPTHEFLKYQDPSSLTFKHNSTQPTGISLFKNRGHIWLEIIMSKYPELLNVNTYCEVLRAEYICQKL